jgi:transposase InsO family protein
VRFAWIENQQNTMSKPKRTRRHRLSLSDLCRVLKVSRSGYYDWRTRPASARRQRSDALAARVRQLHLDSKRIFGSPRIAQQLKANGIACCRNTIAKLMKRQHLRSKTRRRFVPRTTDPSHPHPVAQNLLKQNFQQHAQINRAWSGDITAIRTDQGWLYLAVLLDLCSRKVVGWSMAAQARGQLCIDALRMAITHRRPSAGLLHHSDRGVQYACEAYQRVLHEHGMTCSMSRVGNCYDNAVSESFFASLKRELVHDQRYATHEQARASIVRYIEVFYNRQRPHSSLGYRSPDAFERDLDDEPALAVCPKT